MSIAYVGGANNNAGSAATIAATYSPIAGNIVVVYVCVGGSVSAVSVKDNNGNYLLGGPTTYNSTNVAAGTGQLYAFYGIAQAGATTYTANWTTSQVSSIALVEYSGVGQVYFINGGGS